MMYKNTIKLLFSNFRAVWNILIFLIIATLLSGLLSFIFCSPIINALTDGGLFIEISNTYTSFVTSLNLTQFFIDITVIGDLFANIILLNMNSLLVYIILFLFSFFVVSNFMRSFYLLASSNYLNYYMGNKIRKSFTACFFEDFGKNVKYSLLYLVTIFPIKLLIYLVVYQSLRLLAYGGFMAVVAPFITIAIYVILSSIRITIFSCWVPMIVRKGEGVFKALFLSESTLRKRWLTTFSNSIFIVLTILFINVFVGIFTFGVAWVVTIPISYFITAIFNMVCYYTSTGSRFYVDDFNVVAPKRMEHTDQFSKLKNII